MVCSCLRTARTTVGLSCCRFHLTFEFNEAPLRSRPSKNLDAVVEINQDTGVLILDEQFCARAFVLWSCVAVLKK